MRLALALPLLFACNGGPEDSSADDTADTEDTADTDDGAIEIAGSWADGFGGTHVITDATWTMSSEWGTSVFDLSWHDNAANAAVAQNHADNDYNPGAWSRFDWTGETAALHFCQTAFDAATEDDAKAVAAADAGDLEAGCGGFAWSALTAQ